MDLDRSSLPDPRQQDLRARSVQVQELLAKPAGVEATPTQPAHGGATGNQRAENGPRKSEEEATAKDRRKSAMASVVEFLSLPVDTELDIEVDVQEEQVSFVIRDRETGEVLRTIPEGDAADLVSKLRDFHGGLVDRSL
ncbi:MAG: flagellar protein FlaG [Planctomycetes bacterium]|nr:flagellar protein FlaG [Planctomycetota bacterium]